VIAAACIAVAAIAAYCWQDGINPCQDGARYTSGEPQPSPFHRRFHAWPPRVLMIVTWASFVATAAMLGTPQRALMFLVLPGAWMCCVMPTTVDGPSMATSVVSSILVSRGDSISIACGVAMAALGGAMHERAPVFAALYAWSPWPLLGLVAVQWWSRPALARHSSPELADRLVGHKSTLATMLAHKPHVDLLNEGGLVWALRGIPLWAAHAGAPLQAWVALAVAFASRLVGTDTARCLMWAAPAFLMHMDPPWWVVALHVVTFRRVMR
jgi:hypothetical protein